MKIKLSIILLMVLLLNCTSTEKPNTDDIKDAFASKRASNSVTVYINGTIDKVFPLFGTYEERKWNDKWDPEPIYPHNEAIEEGSSFLTSGFTPDDPKFIWIVTKYEPENHLVQFLTLTEHSYWIKTVKCNTHNGNQTSVTITYSYTSLNSLGNKVNTDALNAKYEENIKVWANKLNKYLKNEITN